MTQKLGLEVVAIDGKTLKGSYERENSLRSLEMVSAWSSSHRLVLGQVAVDQKSNEIKAIPVLLEQLELSGGIITIDAMGSQTAIAQQINSAGTDYILTLKSNHPSLTNQAYFNFLFSCVYPDKKARVIGNNKLELKLGENHTLSKKKYFCKGLYY